jgi:Ca2+-binding RTX toxin-like protein
MITQHLITSFCTLTSDEDDYGTGGNDVLIGGADADSYLFIGTFGNDEVKDNGKGDKLYIDDVHIKGEAYETAAGSGIYTLEDITVTQAGNGIKLTTGSGKITLTHWSEDYCYISKNDNNPLKSSQICA